MQEYFIILETQGKNPVFPALPVLWSQMEVLIY